MTYSLLIIYNDKREVVITGVTNYGILDSPYDCFYFIKNGYKSFIPKTDISYFGREFDWKNN